MFFGWKASSSSRPHLPSLHFITFNTQHFQHCFAVPCNACKKFTIQVVGSAIQLMPCPGQGLNDQKYVLDLTVLLMLSVFSCRYLALLPPPWPVRIQYVAHLCALQYTPNALTVRTSSIDKVCTSTTKVCTKLLYFFTTLYFKTSSDAAAPLLCTVPATWRANQ